MKTKNPIIIRFKGKTKIRGFQSHGQILYSYIHMPHKLITLIILLNMGFGQWYVH